MLDKAVQNSIRLVCLTKMEKIFFPQREPEMFCRKNYLKKKKKKKNLLLTYKKLNSDYFSKLQPVYLGHLIFIYPTLKIWNWKEMKEPCFCYSALVICVTVKLLTVSLANIKKKINQNRCILIFKKFKKKLPYKITFYQHVIILE